MSNMVEVRNVSMCFNLEQERTDTLKEYVLKFMKKQLKYTEFQALKDVSFTVERGSLYDIEERFPHLDPLIKTLLRFYTGLFLDFATIDEAYIAKLLGVSRQEVYERLLELNRLGVVNYNPQTKASYITWLQDREQDQYMVFPKSVYADRLADARARSESVIAYCSDQNRCRSRMLLEYFGDESGANCGQCDTCIAHKNSRDITAEEYNAMVAYVKQRLCQGPVNRQAMCESPDFDPGRQEVYERLLELNRLGVVNYNPQTKASYITWLQDREQDQYMVFPKSVYADRLADARARSESVIAYCSDQNRCRSRMLLEYFGDESGANCGQCDTCIAHKNSRDITAEEYNAMVAYVKQRLCQGPVNRQAMCESPDFDPGRLSIAISVMTQDGTIEMDQMGMLSLKQ